jgi:hypothetical protein
MADPRRLVPRTDLLLADPRLVEAERVLGRVLVKSVVAQAQERARAGEIEPEQVAYHECDGVGSVPGLFGGAMHEVYAASLRDVRGFSKSVG